MALLFLLDQVVSFDIDMIRPGPAASHLAVVPKPT